MIFSGAIDICIDGLNEVDPNTRAEIRNFVDLNFHGNIIMTTQPIDWMPPTRAQKFVLQPLTDEAIQQFLISRESTLLKHSTVSGRNYEDRCRKFLQRALDPDQPEETLDAIKRSLSNPMDLTLVAGLLAEEKEPDLFHLQQQQYDVMACEYKRTHVETGFRLIDFAEAVYQMRLNDRTTIPEEEFVDELKCMERFKMVIRRYSSDATGKTIARWYFRHDKIMDFFVVQTFLKHEDQPPKHLGDSRFRGVYFLLATLLEMKAAERLKEELLQHTVKTNDTTVLRRFVDLLNSRTTDD